MNFLKSISYPFIINSLLYVPRFRFARAVMKLSKKKDEIKQDTEMAEPIQAKIFKDLQKTEHNEIDFDEETTHQKNKFNLGKIETYPDLLTPEDLVKAVQKLTPTIDQVFVNDLKENGDFDDHQWQKLKKKLRILPSSSLIKISKTFSDFPKFNKMDSVWIPLENEFSARLKNMSFDEIVKMLWCFAYSNRKNREFFRRIENELYDREWKYAHINHIGKMLWAFSFADLGSAELYSKMAETIKLVQYEIPPMKIAEYANYFSKSSENVQGGFGVYKVAEKRLAETLNDYNFHDLIKIALLLIPQNIGSNEFYKNLEERILENFPNKEEVPLSDLVRLAKAMSLFRYQSTNLKDKIENNVIKYAEFMSNSQFEETLWSFTRGRKGSKTLYEKLENEFLKRVNLFKPRSLAFAYYGFSSTRNGSANFYDICHKRIEEKLKDFNPHCLLKILRGMQIMNVVDRRDKLIAQLLNTGNLKITEMIKLLMIINDSNINILTENQTLYNDLFNKIMVKFKDNFHLLKIDDKCQIFYSYILHNKFTEKTFQLIVQEIPNANSVPKSIFCQTLWSMIQCKCFDFAKEFIPIVNNLKSFGDIKFFFDHDNFIKLSWSLIILNFNSGTDDKKYQLDKAIWETIKEAILNINPNTLKAIENVGLWLQTLSLLGTVTDTTEEEIRGKVTELTDFTKKSLASSTKLNVNHAESESTREEIEKLIETIVAEKPIKGVEIQLIKGFYDDLFNFIDIALIWGRNKRAGIRVRNKKDYLFEDLENKQFYLMKNEMNDRILESVLGWKILTIEEEEFKEKEETQKRFMISKFLKNIKK